MPHINAKSNVAFLIAAIAGLTLRVGCAYIGDNFDIESYWKASALNLWQDSIYASEVPYNYGPIWFLILKTIKKSLGFFGEPRIQQLHVAIAYLLAITDIILAIFCYSRIGLLSAIIFLLHTHLHSNLGRIEHV